MQIEEILITVRTYPTLSEKYQETVCTGGINSNGEWRRLYPVQWRFLEKEKQYRQYDVIEANISSVTSDGRPESRRIDAATIKLVDHLDDWNSRVDWVKPTVIDSMEAMKATGRTLAPVRVQEIKEFIALPDDPEWSPKQRDMLRQDGLFDGPIPLEKIPFDFRLRWVDGAGEEHDSKFLDWEVCEAWRKFRRENDPIKYLERAWREKKFSDRQSIYFYMGNFKQHPQHFGVCGVFCPPKGLMDEQTLW